jgi:hypothetical protein
MRLVAVQQKELELLKSKLEPAKGDASGQGEDQGGGKAA